MKTRLTLTAGLLAAATAAAGSAVLSTPPAGAAAPFTVTNGCLNSVPDPGTSAPVKICYTLFQPAEASAEHPVPIIMHSHGWGGSRTTTPVGKVGSPNPVRPYLEAGYGAISFDQRGFGDSGGTAQVENPDAEGYDVRALIDLVSKLPWVQQDGPGDPHIGAIGGSYGGGYQFLGAFEELRTAGRPVFDALAPEITWNDLHDSLAPNGVARTEWAAALSGGALPSTALPPFVYKALVEAAITGNWPDGSTPGGEDLDAFFEKNGPKWHVSQGRRLDIPVLFGQGMTDTLFNTQQGLDNWATALTPSARNRSMFIGYNGGHVLPGLFPQAIAVTSDPCSKKLGGGTFANLALRFFDQNLRGIDSGLSGFGKLHLATAYSQCTTVDSVEPNTAYDLGSLSTTTVAGPTVTKLIAKGPLKVAGSAYLTAAVTTRTPASRVFYGLAIGSSAANAKLVQGNVMPLNEPTVVTGAKRRIDLPAAAVNVPKHQRLFLLSSPVSDMFAGMGSRIPGLVTLRDTKVHLHVVR